MNDAVANHVLCVADRGPGGRATRARIEVLIMEVRRSADHCKPMVDIGIWIIRGPEVELGFDHLRELQVNDMSAAV
jgi:hypothetical protein